MKDKGSGNELSVAFSGSAACAMLAAFVITGEDNAVVDYFQELRKKQDVIDQKNEILRAQRKASASAPR